MIGEYLLKELKYNRSLKAISQCFSDTMAAQRYAGELVIWTESNEPIAKTRICIIGMFRDRPFPDLVTVFFYEEDEEEFNKWYGKWFEFRESIGKSLGGEDHSYDRASLLLSYFNVEAMASLTPWLGKQPEIEKPVERNLQSEIKDENTPLKPNINLCPMCQNNDKVQKVSAIIYGGTYSGGFAGPSFESDGGFGLTFGYGQVSTQLVKMLSPPPEPSRPIFDFLDRNFNARWNHWNYQIRIWERLYYCYRDGIVYDPITLNYVPPYQINTLLST